MCKDYSRQVTTQLQLTAVVAVVVVKFWSGVLLLCPTQITHKLGLNTGPTLRIQFLAT